MKKIMLSLATTAAMLSVSVAAADKIKVESNEDLPRFTYELEGQLTDFIQSDDLLAFARKRRGDVNSVLERYEVTDATTLQGYYGLILNVQMLEGDFDGARETIEKMRAL
ncbi:MAG: hypothetical protein PVH13_06925, partial [Gammaproteobacteria bacterium]